MNLPVPAQFLFFARTCANAAQSDRFFACLAKCSLSLIGHAISSLVCSASEMAFLAGSHQIHSPRGGLGRGVRATRLLLDWKSSDHAS